MFLFPFTVKSLLKPVEEKIFNEETLNFFKENNFIDISEGDNIFKREDIYNDNNEIIPGIRCINIDFFYIPPYENLSCKEEAILKKSSVHIYEQILYYFLVIKEPMSDKELAEIAKQDFFLPEDIKRRIEKITMKDEQTETGKVLHMLIRRLDDKDKIIELLKDSLKKKEELCKKLNLKLKGSKKALKSLNLKSQYKEDVCKSLSSMLEEKEKICNNMSLQLEKKNKSLENFQYKAGILDNELSLFRTRKITKLIERFYNRTDLSNKVSPQFQQLKDDSLMFHKDFNGFLLQPGPDLRSVTYLEYPLNTERSGLSGILIAPLIDLPLSSGVLGIEIVSPDEKIIIHKHIPLTLIKEDMPLPFEFPPIHNSNEPGFRLRIFAKDGAVCVRILEWRKYSFLGFGSLTTRLFCGFLFNGRSSH